MSTTKIPMSKAPVIPMAQCKSSQVACYGYDAATQTLAMQFHQGKGVSAVYHYPGFTPEQYEELQKAESKGRFFGQVIKPMDCQKLVPDEQLEQQQAA